ncbi:unnamed protein product [Prorocentrum cordatum]|uniref:Uncharacterized protein n=1 Tax=Prorocentrum cordatum TaxID=2364126 RepID=A0ABN9WZQ9_9DINO|nr:unnamed protein product [Polarella glacialis]
MADRGAKPTRRRQAAAASGSEGAAGPDRHKTFVDDVFIATARVGEGGKAEEAFECFGCTDCVDFASRNLPGRAFADVVRDKKEDENFAQEVDGAMNIGESDEAPFGIEAGEGSQIGGTLFEDYLAPNHHQVVSTWKKTPKQLCLRPLKWRGRNGVETTVYPIKENDNSWPRLRLYSESFDYAMQNLMQNGMGCFASQPDRVMTAQARDTSNPRRAFSTIRLPTVGAVNDRSAELGGGRVQLTDFSPRAAGRVRVSEVPPTPAPSPRGSGAWVQSGSGSGNPPALAIGDVPDHEREEGVEDDDEDIEVPRDAAACYADSAVSGTRRTPQPSPTSERGPRTPGSLLRGSSGTVLPPGGRHGIPSEIQNTPNEFQKGTPEYWIHDLNLTCVMAGAKLGQGPHQLEVLLGKVPEGKLPTIRKHLHLATLAKEIVRMETLHPDTLNKHMAELTEAGAVIPAAVQLKLVKYWGKKDYDVWSKGQARLPSSTKAAVFVEEVLISYLIPLILGDAPMERQVLDFIETALVFFQLPEECDISEECAQAVVEVKQICEAIQTAASKTIGKSAQKDTYADIGTLQAAGGKAGATDAWAQVGAALGQSPHWKTLLKNVISREKVYLELAPLVAQDLSEVEALSKTMDVNAFPVRAKSLIDRLPNYIARLGAEPIQMLETSLVQVIHKAATAVLEKDFPGDTANDPARYHALIESYSEVVENVYQVCQFDDAISRLKDRVMNAIRSADQETTTTSIIGSMNKFREGMIDIAVLHADVKRLSLSADSATDDLQAAVSQLWDFLMKTDAIQTTLGDKFDVYTDVLNRISSFQSDREKLAFHMDLIKKTSSLRSALSKFIGDLKERDVDMQMVLTADPNEKLWRAFVKAKTDLTTCTNAISNITASLDEVGLTFRDTYNELVSLSETYYTQAVGLKMAARKDAVTEASEKLQSTLDQSPAYSTYKLHVSDTSSWADIVKIADTFKELAAAEVHHLCDELNKAVSIYLTKRSEYQVPADPECMLVENAQLNVKQCAAIAAMADITRSLTDDKLVSNKVSLRSSLQKVQGKLRFYKVEPTLLHSAVAFKFKAGLTLNFRP